MHSAADMFWGAQKGLHFIAISDPLFLLLALVHDVIHSNISFEEFLGKVSEYYWTKN